MTKKESLQLFEEKKVRTVWDDKEEKWYFSIVDVCGVLTEQPDTEHARNYWKVLKHRLVKEGNQTVTNCNRLKLRASDGKLRMTAFPHYSVDSFTKGRAFQGMITWRMLLIKRYEWYDSI